MVLDDESGNFKDKTSFLFDVIKRYDHYVATINFKVGLMMSFVGAVVLGLTIRVISLNPAGSGCNYSYYSALMSSALTIIIALFAAINLLRSFFLNSKIHGSDKFLFFFVYVSLCK